MGCLILHDVSVLLTLCVSFKKRKLSYQCEKFEKKRNLVKYLEITKVTNKKRTTKMTNKKRTSKRMLQIFNLIFSYSISKVVKVLLVIFLFDFKVLPKRKPELSISNSKYLIIVSTSGIFNKNSKL